MNIKNTYHVFIPSLFTLSNLLFGFLALAWTMERNYRLAAGMVLLSVLMDTFDGKVARRLAVSSNFGKELDSLCDVVSFGVAPALLTYQVVLRSHLGYYGLALSALFALCGAIRLARFNTLNITTHFLGVPITFAGGFVSLLVLFRESIPWGVFPVCLALFSVLMVSSFKVPKLGH